MGKLVVGRPARALSLALLLAAVSCNPQPAPAPLQGQTTPGAQNAPAAATTPGAASAPGKAQPTPAGVPVGTVAATRGSIRSTLAYSGTVQPVQQTNLSPKTAGRIEKIYVDVGDQVKAGQPLVQLDQASLQAAVQQAQANVRSAQAKVTQIQQGARPEDVETARAQLDAARAKLAAMQAGGQPTDVGVAQAGVEQAQAKLAQVQSSIKPADVGTAEQNVKAAQGAYDTAVSALNKLKTPNEAELTQAKVALEKAQAAVQQAQAAYDRIKWMPSAAGRPEALALQQATLDYQNAQAAYQLKVQPRQSDVDAAEKQVQTARAQLDAAQMKLDQLRAGPAPEDLAAAQAGVVQAQQQLAKAQQPNSPTDIQQQQDLVVQAEQNLALKTNPYTPADVEAAQAALAQAQSQLVQAQSSAQEGAILAPYDGVVVSRPLAEGSLVSPGTVAMTIASVDVEVPINVEEARINDVQAGQSATIASPALPGVTFPAKVASVAPTADQKTHSFPVKIRPDPPDRRLRSGMFANVQITTAAHQNAVLVPRDAVVTRDGKPVVYVVADGKVRQVDVSGGLADDQNQEVPSGVNPGDQVVVQGQATLGDGDPVRPSPAALLPTTPTPAPAPAQLAG